MEVLLLVFFGFVFIENAICVYLDSYRQQDQLPTPVGFLFFANVTRMFVIAGMVWLFGFLWGIIAAAFILLNFVQMSITWIVHIRFTIKLAKESYSPPVNRTIYGSYTFACLAVSIVAITAFFVARYEDGLRVFQDNVTYVYLLVGVILVGFLLRMITFGIMKKKYNITE
jgi:hypothetical protein